jgi:hypothetical protein
MNVEYLYPYDFKTDIIAGMRLRLLLDNQDKKDISGHCYHWINCWRFACVIAARYKNVLWDLFLFGICGFMHCLWPYDKRNENVATGNHYPDVRLHHHVLVVGTEPLAWE